MLGTFDSGRSRRPANKPLRHGTIPNEIEIDIAIEIAPSPETALPALPVLTPEQPAKAITVILAGARRRAGISKADCDFDFDFDCDFETISPDTNAVIPDLIRDLQPSSGTLVSNRHGAGVAPEIPALRSASAGMTVRDYAA